MQVMRTAGKTYARRAIALSLALGAAAMPAPCGAQGQPGVEPATAATAQSQDDRELQNLQRAEAILDAAREGGLLSVALRPDLKRGEVEQALAWINQCLAVHRDSAEALRYLAVAEWTLALMDDGDTGGPKLSAALTSRALPPAQRSVELEPGDWRNHLCQARILLDCGDAPGALAAIRKALVLDPRPQHYVDAITALTAKAAEPREVDALWSELLTRFPDDPVTLRANGDRLFAQESYSAAEEAYARAAQLAPDDPDLPRLIGDCRMARGDYAGAATFYERSLRTAYDPAVVANLAGAYAQANRRTAAVVLFDNYVAKHPDDASLAEEYGDVLCRLGEYEPALAQLERAQQLAPADASVCYHAAQCLRLLKRPADALAKLDLAIALEPQPEYYAEAAGCSLDLGDQAKAERFCRDGLAQFPSDASLLLWLAGLLREHGRALELLPAMLTAAAEPTSGDPWTRVRLYSRAAEIALAAGDTAQAERAYRAAIALAKPDASVYASLGSLLISQRRDADLLKLVQDARGALPTGGYRSFMDALAAAWSKSGDVTRARAFCEQLIALDPRDPAPYLSLAQVENAAGNAAQALAALKRGLNDAGDDYVARLLEVQITSKASGPAAALPLAEALLSHPSLDEAGVALCCDLYARLGDSAKREATARRGLTRLPQSASLLSHLAQALLAQGKLQALAAALESPEYGNADYPERGEMLGLAYLDLGNYVKAVGFFSAALKRTPDSPALLAELGEAQYFQGDNAGARGSLAAALRLDAASVPAHLWLGFVLIEQGDLTGANTAFSFVEKAVAAETSQLAWAALGQGRLAALAGELDSARIAFDQAAAFGLSDLRFTSALAEARRQAGL